MAETILRAKIVADFDSGAKRFVDIISRGTRLNVSGGGAGGGSDSQHKETKGLLSKIVAGVALGNIIASSFNEFLRPIFQLIKAVAALFFIPLIPFIKAISYAFATIFPDMLQASKDIQSNFEKFTTGKGIAGVFGFGDNNSTTSNTTNNATSGSTGSILDAILAWAGKVDTGAIATVIGAALGVLVAAVFGVAGWPLIIAGVVGAAVIPPIVNFLVTTILGVIEFIGLGIASVWGFLSAKWDSLTQFISQAWQTIIVPALSKAWISITTFVGKLVTGVVDGLKGAFNFILGGLFGAVNAIIGFLKGLKFPLIGSPFSGLQSLNIPKLDTGGFIEQTGVAVVHKGETVVPAGASGSVNYSPTYNISADVDGQALKKMLKEHDNEFLSLLRQRTSMGGRFFNA